jgi:hypothetical protein
MDLYIYNYKRWQICAGDLHIVREQLTATLITIGLCVEVNLPNCQHLCCLIGRRIPLRSDVTVAQRAFLFVKVKGPLNMIVFDKGRP